MLPTAGAQFQFNVCDPVKNNNVAWLSQRVVVMRNRGPTQSVGYSTMPSLRAVAPGLCGSFIPQRAESKDAATSNREGIHLLCSSSYNCVYKSV